MFPEVGINKSEIKSTILYASDGKQTKDFNNQLQDLSLSAFHSIQLNLVDQISCKHAYLLIDRHGNGIAW